MFPKSNYSPAQFFQCTRYLPVVPSVGFNFLRPKLAVRGRYITATVATVPKTSINKNRDSSGVENEVGFTHNISGVDTPARNAG